MSSIAVKLYRSEDNRLLQIVITLEYKSSYDYATISFKCKDEHVEAISASKGKIDSFGNVETTDTQLEVYVDYPQNNNELDCLIGYYENDELKEYENLMVTFDNTKHIEKSGVQIEEVRTIPSSFQQRFANFFERLETQKSSWSVDLSYSDDVISLLLNAHGKAPVMVSFGENSKEILSSDYIFQLYPNVLNLHLPKDLLKRKYSYYQQGTKLGIFELVRPDFVASNDLYYKVKISNLLSLSDFAG